MDLIDPSLNGKFDFKEQKDDWHLFCKKCGQGWALKKSSNHPGNILHLLNHYAGHEEKKRKRRA